MRRCAGFVVEDGPRDCAAMCSNVRSVMGVVVVVGVVGMGDVVCGVCGGCVW